MRPLADSEEPTSVTFNHNTWRYIADLLRHAPPELERQGRLTDARSAGVMAESIENQLNPA